MDVEPEEGLGLGLEVGNERTGGYNVMIEGKKKSGFCETNLTTNLKIASQDEKPFK